MAWNGMGHHVQSFGGAGEHFGGEYPHMHGQYPQMAGAYGQMPAPQHWYGQDWYQHPPAAPFDYRFSQGYMEGPPIQNAPPMQGAPWGAEAYPQWTGGNQYQPDWWQGRPMDVGYHPENQEIPARPHENAAAGPEIVEGQKKGKRKRYEDDDRDRRGMPGDDFSLCYLCSCREQPMFKIPIGHIYCESCLDTYFEHKRYANSTGDDPRPEDAPKEDIQVACPAERSVIRINDRVPVSDAEIRMAKLQKEEAHRMTDTSIELRPERVKASRPWPITGPQVLGTPKTGEWEDAYFDIFEYGERGWAYAVRLNDGIFGWLPYEFTTKVTQEEDPAPTCEDAEAAARRWFSIVNPAVLNETEHPEIDPWQPPTTDPPRLDQSEEAAELAAAWIAKWGPDKPRDDVDRAERDPFLRTGRARARCLSPDDAAAYLGIPDEDP